MIRILLFFFFVTLTTRADTIPPGIESVLYEVYQDWQSQRYARAKQTLNQYDTELVQSNRVIVTLEPDSIGQSEIINTDELEEIQAEILTRSRSLLKVSVPIPMLPRLTQVSGVNLVRTPIRPILNAVESEGLPIIQTQRFHNAGHKGSGVKVAVIDRGFYKYQSAQSGGDLPANLNVIGYSNNGNDHGTSCAEIIYDIAPEVELFLFQYDDFLDFENLIDDCIRRRIGVISYAGGWITGWGDGKGEACDIANRANNSGILFVNAAGNMALSTYHGQFLDTDNDQLHNFGEYNLLRLENVQPDSEIDVILIWDDFPRTSEDYDLYLYRGHWPSTTATRIKSSTTIQRSSRPLESIKYKVASGGWTVSYHVAVRKKSTARSMKFRLISYRHAISEDWVSPENSLNQPADAQGVVAVGAIHHGRYNRGPQEDYSSQGPTSDGRIKPDIVAPTGVSTYSYGDYKSDKGFYGTSAATPHVAGAAALILSASPELTVSELRDKLFEATVDMGSPGKDNIYGHGRLDLSQIDITPSVFHAGDFDGDLDVDILDLLAFSEVYGLTSSDPNYDARMDMDNNGVIDVLDLLLFAEVYGKTYS